MRIGLHIASYMWPGGPDAIARHLTEIARTADEAGFARLSLMDHFFQIEGLGQHDDPVLEPYAALSYLAGVTKRLRLGALVTAVVFRHPGVLARSVSTLDVLSSGRAFLGIGAAWHGGEAHALGVPFPPLKERFERLEEAVQIMLRMWSDDSTAYHGKHYELAEPFNRPQPLSKPHPPILIGGMGEKKTLRLVAQYGDACNLFASGDYDAIRAKLAVLRQHCQEVGRPYDEIDRTAVGTIDLRPGAMTIDDVIVNCRELASAGIHELIVMLPNAHEISPIETIGRDVIPVVADFDAA